MSLTNVWVQTQGDGLVRADQIVGIDAHQTPALTGKPSRWLLDVVLAAPIGSGAREGWALTMVHRTLTQTPEDPGEAPAALARLLAQLDQANTAGIISISQAATPATTGTAAPDASAAGSDEFIAVSSTVRFRFVPFPHPAPGHHTGAEYL